MQPSVVQVESFDKSSGIITWYFKGRDIDTGDLADFLPPNTDASAPQGEGWVSYSVSPKAGLATGTQITNTASIIFDTNAPISTPTWLNTIDNGRPGSHVEAMPPIRRFKNFIVNWSGVDANSGIRDYTVFVSDNGGPFSAWLSNTADTTTIFAGEQDHTYAFYSRARNQAGNMENDRGAADTMTKVAFGAEGQSFTIDRLKGTIRFGAPGQTTCFIAGQIPDVDAAFMPAGTTITLAVDDGKITFTLNAKGKAKTPEGTFTLKDKAQGSKD